MNKWWWALILVIQAHFGASYVVPTQPRLGLFNYVWPWAVGDHGLFGTHPNLPGIALGGASGLLSFLAALAVLSIWLPRDSWRVLAMVGAALLLVLMIGYLSPTKILPIAWAIAVLVIVWMKWLPVEGS